MNEKDTVDQTDVLALLLDRENKSAQIDDVLESRDDAIRDFEE